MRRSASYRGEEECSRRARQARQGQSNLHRSRARSVGQLTGTHARTEQGRSLPCDVGLGRWELWFVGGKNDLAETRRSERNKQMRSQDRFASSRRTACSNKDKGVPSLATRGRVREEADRGSAKKIASRRRRDAKITAESTQIPSQDRFDTLTANGIVSTLTSSLRHFVTSSLGHRPSPSSTSSEAAFHQSTRCATDVYARIHYV
jgi:hypothetical protein